MRLIEGLDIPADAKLIGSVGRLWAQKNVALQIRAAAVLKKKLPGAYWLIIGDGPDSDSLSALAESLDVADRVRFLGWRPDASRLTGGLDAFVQTSRFEGCSLSMLDAMAHALPVVSTNARGANELVIDGQTGILTPPDDPSAIASALDKILSDRALADSFGRAARDRQRLAFSYETYREAYIDLYKQFTFSR
jgi:glycosyltransferase involved in cell wall biosynthesis